MKNNRYNIVLLFLFFVTLPIEATDSSQNNASFTGKIYQTLKNDLSLIKKCYLSKTKCSKEEIQNARISVARVSLEIMAVAAIVATKKPHGCHTGPQ